MKLIRIKNLIINIERALYIEISVTKINVWFNWTERVNESTYLELDKQDFSREEWDIIYSFFDEYKYDYILL